MRSTVFGLRMHTLGEDEFQVSALFFIISPKDVIAGATRSGKPVPGTAARAMLL
jgi:hypothetical protein